MKTCSLCGQDFSAWALKKTGCPESQVSFSQKAHRSLRLELFWEVFCLLIVLWIQKLEGGWGWGDRDLSKIYS